MTHHAPTTRRSPARPIHATTTDRRNETISTVLLVLLGLLLGICLSHAGTAHVLPTHGHTHPPTTHHATTPPSSKP